ncbi:hypothetical protein ACFPVX_16240 [Cohnella faecalis]|uniref:Polymer-forming cytoskeletal protein n=1 Tax=Cohnella faecalis TaxID=2315694 RepID=A0A398CN69_9BACL|nr:hypothetical protein [Cohnella faecalis]RIE02689.1 hypothetical protein D3H35_18700 [Cohnella faecalis]
MSENNDNQLTDLIIDGVSSSAGGQYRNVKINGVGKVGGELVSRTFAANGHISVQGSLRTEELDCDGKLSVRGSAQVTKGTVDGMAGIEGAFRGEHLILNGLLTVRGDCEIERFEAEGGFTVDGLLSAGTLDVRLHGRGKARDVGVEWIRVRQASKSRWNLLWRWAFPKFSPELLAGTIEGDDIDLEYTIADIVRGNRVVVGKGCVIGRVEYKDHLSVHPDAKVGEEAKSGGR